MEASSVTIDDEALLSRVTVKEGSGTSLYNITGTGYVSLLPRSYGLLPSLAASVWPIAVSVRASIRFHCSRPSSRREKIGPELLRPWNRPPLASLSV